VNFERAIFEKLFLRVQNNFLVITKESFENTPYPLVWYSAIYLHLGSKNEKKAKSPKL